MMMTVNVMMMMNAVLQCAPCPCLLTCSVLVKTKLQQQKEQAHFQFSFRKEHSYTCHELFLKVGQC